MFQVNVQKEAPGTTSTFDLGGGQPLPLPLAFGGQPLLQPSASQLLLLQQHAPASTLLHHQHHQQQHQQPPPQFQPQLLNKDNIEDVPGMMIRMASGLMASTREAGATEAGSPTTTTTTYHQPSTTSSNNIKEAGGSTISTDAGGLNVTSMVECDSSVLSSKSPSPPALEATTNTSLTSTASSVTATAAAH